MRSFEVAVLCFKRHQPTQAYRIDNIDTWRDFAGVPTTGEIRTHGGTRALQVMTSRRDGFYVSTGDNLDTAAVVLFDIVDDGLVLQLLDPVTFHAKGSGMCDFTRAWLCCSTCIATKSAPYARLITTSALALQSQHRNASLAPAR